MTHPKSDKPLRPDLQQVREARAAILDDARPKAVAQQRKRGRWTAREGIAVLVDPDSFVEYGGLARPAVSGMTGAADGVVMGTAQIDGRPVDLLIYDYTVYAGTQSAINHMKTTRMFEHAERHRLPVVCWLDGGGARPHDMKVEGRGATPTFVVFARLSGLVPTIGILPGRAFAGHANLAGMCDVLIATKDSTLGMAGPPLVEAALGVKLCAAFDIPILSLCDTPGLMVGPDVERTGLVRKSARVLTAFANATVPVMTVVLRKAYGLGYYVMGSQPLNPAILLAWPTAEYGGMGLEGAVNIIYKAELDAVADAEERAALHKRLTDALKRSNTAIEVAARYHYDDVIDPADTRNILIKTLATLPPPPPRTTRKRLIEPF